MPVMNGLKLCETLYGQNFEGVMLIHTAYARFAYARKAVALNVFDYILNPIDINKSIKGTISNVTASGFNILEKEVFTN